MLLYVKNHLLINHVEFLFCEADMRNHRYSVVMFVLISAGILPNYAQEPLSALPLVKESKGVRGLDADKPHVGNLNKCSGQLNSDTILGCFQPELAATRY
jgi:hypothetical protein